MSSELLRYQVQSAAWANQRVLSAASLLTPEELTRDFQTSERSVLGTLVHIYRAERVWISRIEGVPVEFQAEGDQEMSALTSRWPKVSQRWLQWAETVTDESAGAEITYRDLRNNVWTQRVWQMVLHVVNHSTHHRGQAIGFLRALGQTPPNTDSITFARQMG